MAYTTNPKLPKVRRDAVRLVKYQRWSTRKVARYTGYSQSVIVKWCKRDPTGGWREIPTKSSRPKSHPKTIGREITDRIVALRFETNGRCAEVIHQMLKNEGTTVSLNTVRRTLDRRGLVKKRSHLKRRHVSVPRPHVATQGDLIQVDTIHLMKNKKERIYVFTLIDDIVGGYTHGPVRRLMLVLHFCFSITQNNEHRSCSPLYRVTMDQSFLNISLND